MINKVGNSKQIIEPCCFNLFIYKRTDFVLCAHWILLEGEEEKDWFLYLPSCIVSIIQLTLSLSTQNKTNKQEN